MSSDSEELPYLKCVCIGDGAVGKTCLLLSYVQREFPKEYIPTVMDNYYSKITVDDSQYQIDLWDGGYIDDFCERRNIFIYRQTDIFVVCFSLVNKISLENVKLRWVPEVKWHCPESKIILVGTKNDLVSKEMRTGKSYKISNEQLNIIHSKVIKYWLRKNTKFDVSNITHTNFPNDLMNLMTKFSQNIEQKSELASKYGNYSKPVTQSEINKIFKEINASDYISCSALTGDGIDQIFEAAVRVHFRKYTKEPKKRKKCQIL